MSARDVRTRSMRNERRERWRDKGDSLEEQSSSCEQEKVQLAIDHRQSQFCGVEEGKYDEKS